MKRERELSSVDIIVSQTDLKGNIIYANLNFYKFSGYERDSLIGKSYNITKDSDMPKAIFKYFWEKLKQKEEIYCFIKNSSKDNQYYYWVFSHIYPSLNKDKTVRNYISVSYPISPKAKEIIEKLYKELLRVERYSGVDISLNLFKKFIETNRYKKESDNQVIYNIQY